MAAVFLTPLTDQPINVKVIVADGRSLGIGMPLVIRIISFIIQSIF